LTSSKSALRLSAAVAGLLAIAPYAHAAAAAPSAEPAQPTAVDEVVVTGTARTSGLKRLDAGFSITTATAEQIREAAPTSTADILKIVPGVFAETTGGTAGANIEVRGFPTGGDAQYVTIQLDGSPVFAVPTLSFLENSSIFRIDDTVQRLEVLRGGPSPIYSNGQPGVTLNFMQKNGADNPGGSLRATVGDDGLYRFDGYYGGKIAEGWYASLGGFWRTEKGVRSTQFPSDRGGQIVGTLTHDLENGRITVYGRKLNDSNAFFTDIPLISSDNGNKIHGYPGLDPLTGSLLGNELRRATFQVSPGATPGTVTRDVTRGRGANVFLGGVDYHQDIDGWSVSNKFNYTSGDTPTFALFNGANPLTLGEFESKLISSSNANAAIVAVAGRPATAATATFTNGGGAVDPATNVIPIQLWSVEKHIKSVTDEARVTHDLFEGNAVTAGVYFAAYSADDNWNLGNTVLMTVQNHGRLVDVNLNNGVQGSLHGFIAPTFFALRANYDGRNIAGFISDEWKLTDQLKVDAGVRVEQEHITGSIENNSTVDLDGNPTTLFNNGASALNGTSSSIDFTKTHASWTAGVTYRINTNFSAFGRVNSGFRFPDFDDLRSGLPQIETIQQYETGLKAAGGWYAANVTLFYNHFKGEPFQQFLADGTQVTETLASRSYGVEFEGTVQPIDHVALDVSGNYQHSEYTDAANDGNRTQRQPAFQVRLTPSYTIPTDWGRIKAYLTVSHIGKRFADVQNLQPLPSYDTLDLGVVVDVGQRWQLLFTGTNVTNTLGITEGNARVIGSGVGAGGVFEGRPLFGAQYQVSALMRF
jgi:outer membrane receptor protein involved in Fe transport